jgi:HEAT repeat protein
VPALSQALHDSARPVCWKSAAALGQIGKSSVGVLTVALDDPDSEIRHASAYALGVVGSDAAPAINALIYHLADTNNEVRASLVDSLGKIGPEALGALREAVRGTNQISSAAAAEALDKLQKSFRAQLPELLAMKNDPDEHRRVLAIEALSAIKPPSRVITNALTEALSDTSPIVQLATIKVLAQLGVRGSAALPKLEELSQCGNRNVQFAARDAAARISLAVEYRARQQSP